MLALHFLHGLGHYRAAYPVVHRAAGRALAQLHIVGNVNGHIAYGNLLFGFLAACAANVYIQLVKRGLIHAVLGGVFKIGNALYAVFKNNLACGGYYGINAANAGNAQEAFFIYCDHYEANLVHVRAEHYLLSACAALVGDKVAHGIAVYLVRIGGDVLLYSLGSPILASGGAVCAEYVLYHSCIHKSKHLVEFFVL